MPQVEGILPLPTMQRRDYRFTTRYLEVIMNLWISIGAVLVGTFATLRFLYWYFNATVCIECYKIVRVRQAKSAGNRNKDMYLCKECSE